MSKIKIAIINLNISNVGSVSRALFKNNYNFIVTNNIKDLEKSSHIIFPGVGSFDKGIEKLKEFKLFDELYKLLTIKKKPFLGICLGMQLLGSIGVENNKEEKGLDIIKGKIIRLEKKNERMKIPHVGWNEVKKIKNNEIFKNINDKSDFYFIHSFHLKSENIEDNISITKYGKDFVSAVNKQNIYGVQFHPEKSLRNGLMLIKNFIDYNA